MERVSLSRGARITAPTKDAKDLAGMITKDTDGVTGVHNNILVE